VTRTNVWMQNPRLSPLRMALTALAFALLMIVCVA
jgi:hypothetical protein